jgi:hypothetical protein
MKGVANHHGPMVLFPGRNAGKSAFFTMQRFSIADGYISPFTFFMGHEPDFINAIAIVKAGNYYGIAVFYKPTGECNIGEWVAAFRSCKA